MSYLIQRLNGSNTTYGVGYTGSYAGTKKLYVRTAANGILTYPLTTDTSASQYCKFKILVSAGKTAYLAKSWSKTTTTWNNSMSKSSNYVSSWYSTVNSTLTASTYSSRTSTFSNSMSGVETTSNVNVVPGGYPNPPGETTSYNGTTRSSWSKASYSTKNATRSSQYNTTSQSTFSVNTWIPYLVNFTWVSIVGISNKIQTNAPYNNYGGRTISSNELIGAVLSTTQTTVNWTFSGYHGYSNQTSVTTKTHASNTLSSTGNLTLAAPFYVTARTYSYTHTYESRAKGVTRWKATYSIRMIVTSGRYRFTDTYTITSSRASTSSYTAYWTGTFSESYTHKTWYYTLTKNTTRSSGYTTTSTTIAGTSQASGTITSGTTHNANI